MGKPAMGADCSVHHAARVLVSSVVLAAHSVCATLMTNLGPHRLQSVLWSPEATEVYVTGSFRRWAGPDAGAVRCSRMGNYYNMWEPPAGTLAVGDQFKFIVRKSTDQNHIATAWVVPTFCLELQQDGYAPMDHCIYINADALLPTSGVACSTAPLTPNSVRDGVIYQIHVATFSEEGTYAGVIAKLDYLASLGATMLEISPVYAYARLEPASWGYDPTHYFAVSGQLGGLRELRKLIDEAHRRGLAVIVDIVYNHMDGATHYWRPDTSYVHGPGLPPQYCRTNDYVNKTLCPFGSFFYQDNRANAAHYGPRPNYDSADVREILLASVELQFRIGIDGLRLDSTLCTRQFSPSGNGCWASDALNNNAGTQLLDAIQELWVAMGAVKAANVPSCSSQSAWPVWAEDNIAGTWGPDTLLQRNMDDIRDIQAYFGELKYTGIWTGVLNNALISLNPEAKSLNSTVTWRYGNHSNVGDGLEITASGLGKVLDFYCATAHTNAYTARQVLEQTSSLAPPVAYTQTHDTVDGHTLWNVIDGVGRTVTSSQRRWTADALALVLPLVIPCTTGFVFQGQETGEPTNFDFFDPPMNDWRLAETQSGIRMIQNMKEAVAAKLLAKPVPPFEFHHYQTDVDDDRGILIQRYQSSSKRDYFMRQVLVVINIGATVQPVRISTSMIFQRQHEEEACRLYSFCAAEDGFLRANSFGHKVLFQSWSTELVEHHGGLCRHAPKDSVVVEDETICVDAHGITVLLARPYETNDASVAALILLLLGFCCVPVVLHIIIIRFCWVYRAERGVQLRISADCCKSEAGVPLQSEPTPGTVTGESVGIKKQYRVAVASIEHWIVGANHHSDSSPLGTPPLKVTTGGLGVMVGVFTRFSPGPCISIFPMCGGEDYSEHFPPESEIDKIDGLLVAGGVECVRAYESNIGNTQYIALSHPVFLQRTRDTLYPDGDGTAAMLGFYALWNQSVARLLSRLRDEIDVFYAPDYHTALANLYLVQADEAPLPTLVALHNASYQGALLTSVKKPWSTISHAIGLSESLIRRCLTSDGFFNMLRGALTVCSVYQGGFGVCAVSGQYAREVQENNTVLPAGVCVWGHPNPFLVEARPPASARPKTLAERKRMKTALQRKLGLEVSTDAVVFAFVGRLVHQKGVDVIADVAQWLCCGGERSNVQLIFVGPIGDVYGQYAAARLSKIAALPAAKGKIFVKPEFFMFTSDMKAGCDWCLMPSRLEPFGFVDIEFAWSGVPIIAPATGGLGKVPGVYYSTINVGCPAHERLQFKRAIEMATKLPRETHEKMRKQCVLVSFPLETWVDTLQLMFRSVIQASESYSGASLRPHAAGFQVMESDLQTEVQRSCIADMSISKADTTKQDASLNYQMRLRDAFLHAHESIVTDEQHRIGLQIYLNHDSLMNQLGAHENRVFTLQGTETCAHAVYTSHSQIMACRETRWISSQLLREVGGTALCNICVATLNVFGPVLAIGLFVVILLYQQENDVVVSPITYLAAFSITRAAGCWFWRHASQRYPCSVLFTTIGAVEIMVLILLGFSLLCERNESEPAQTEVGESKVHHHILGAVFVVYGFFFGSMSPVLVGFAFVNEWHGDVGRMADRQMAMVIATQVALFLGVGLLHSTSQNNLMGPMTIFLLFLIILVLATCGCAFMPESVNCLRLPQLSFRDAIKMKYLPFWLVCGSQWLSSLFIKVLLVIVYCLVSGSATSESTSSMPWLVLPVMIGLTSLGFAVLLRNLPDSAEVLLTSFALFLPPVSWMVGIQLQLESSLSALDLFVLISVTLAVETFRHNVLGLLTMRLLPSRWKWTSFYAQQESVSAVLEAASGALVYTFMNWAFADEGGEGVTQYYLSLLHRGFSTAADESTEKPELSKFLEQRHHSRLGSLTLRVLAPVAFIQWLLLLPIARKHLVDVVFRQLLTTPTFKPSKLKSVESSEGTKEPMTDKIHAWRMSSTCADEDIGAMPCEQENSSSEIIALKRAHAAVIQTKDVEIARLKTMALRAHYGLQTTTPSGPSNVDVSSRFRSVSYSATTYGDLDGKGFEETLASTFSKEQRQNSLDSSIIGGDEDVDEIVGPTSVPNQILTTNEVGSQDGVNLEPSPHAQLEPIVDMTHIVPTQQVQPLDLQGAEFSFHRQSP